MPNKIILAGFIAAGCLQAVYCIFSQREFIIHWVIVMALADIISLAMYFVEIWAAGDAKLFCFLYFCVPCRFIDVDSMRSVIVPYIFIFLPALLWVIIDSLYNTLTHSRCYVNKVSLTEFIFRWLIIFINTMSVHSVIEYFSPEFMLKNGILCSGLLIIYAYICNRVNIMRSVWSFICHIVILLLLFRSGNFINGTGLLKNIAIVMTALVFQRWAGQYNYREIKSNEVKKGMILSSAEVLSFRTSRVRGLPVDFSEKISSRLTQEQAEAVHRWSKSSQGRQKIIL